MNRPFRFGVQLARLPSPGWPDALARLERLGYSTVLLPDHFGAQWDPLATLAGAAGVTSGLRLGTLVCDNDFRHPVVLAKAAATVHVLSGGRLELGVGAGWMISDYEQSGIPFDPIGVRLSRLDESLRILRSLWTRDVTDFEGEHYTIRGMERTVDLGGLSPPALLVGGGGRRMLGLAGRHADIVGINPTMREGRITPDAARDLRPERVAEKLAWVRAGVEASGRTMEDVELNSLVFVVALTDDPKPVREGLARAFGMTSDEIAESPLALTGSAAEIRDRLEARREATGISYVVVQGGDDAVLEQFAEEVVAPLAGR
jgi:probable F420-dependent oxidoreductase